MHRNVLYNCRVICLDKKILGIRPKFCLANDGNYREMRYFTPWYIEPSVPGFGPLEDHFLPQAVQQVTGQLKVPIGIFAVAALDTVLSFETCEELFTPNAPHIVPRRRIRTQGHAPPWCMLASGVAPPRV